MEWFFCDIKGGMGGDKSYLLRLDKHLQKNINSKSSAIHWQTYNRVKIKSSVVILRSEKLFWFGKRRNENGIFWEICSLIKIKVSKMIFFFISEGSSINTITKFSALLSTILYYHAIITWAFVVLLPVRSWCPLWTTPK